MAIKVSGTTVIDDSRNANNIVNLTASGTITLNSLVYPSADGSANYILKTDGSGNLTFDDPINVVPAGGEAYSAY